MENLKEIISKNLIKLRQHAKLTQLELAQKIQYSDKSVSKWERGESLPDIEVLVKLSEIYNTNINTFIEKDNSKIFTQRLKNMSHTMISLLSSAFVFFLASIVFAVLFMIPSTKLISWISFIYAIPISGIILLILNIKWKDILSQAIFSSIIIWGIIISICISIHHADIWSLCVIGFVLELLIIFGFILKKINFTQKLTNIKNKIYDKK